MFDDDDDKMTRREEKESERENGFGTPKAGGRARARGGEKCDYEVLDRRCRRSATNSVKTNPLRMIAEHNTEEWEAMYWKAGSKEGGRRVGDPPAMPAAPT